MHDKGHEPLIFDKMQTRYLLNLTCLKWSYEAFVKFYTTKSLNHEMSALKSAETLIHRGIETCSLLRAHLLEMKISSWNLFICEFYRMIEKEDLELRRPSPRALSLTNYSRLRNREGVIKGYFNWNVNNSVQERDRGQKSS